MEHLSISVLTVCGIDELPSHGPRKVSHVLSLLDPDWPEIDSFQDYGAHHRTTLRFHDIIDPQPGMTLPTREHVAEILTFGTNLAASRDNRTEGHLLVHCHMGVSRSTAAMVSLLAQAFPESPEDSLFEQLRTIRPQAWPNSVMIGHADTLLGRDGRMVAALRRHYAAQIGRKPDFEDWMSRHGRGREVAMANPKP